MNQNDGVLKVQYEVHCYRCEAPVLGLGGDARKAAVELRNSYGWQRINGKWHCAVCVLTAIQASDPTNAGGDRDSTIS
jgi:hypothetical protein